MSRAGGPAKACRFSFFALTLLNRNTLLKNVGILFCLGGVLAGLLFGCTTKQETAVKPEPTSKIIAKVNGTPITEEDLIFRRPGAHGQRKATGDQQKALDDVITEELLYQQGLRIGLDKDPVRCASKRMRSSASVGPTAPSWWDCFCCWLLQLLFTRAFERVLPSRDHDTA